MNYTRVIRAHATDRRAGFIVVGWESFDQTLGRPADPNPDGILLTSPDGQRLMGPSPRDQELGLGQLQALGGTGTQSFESVVPIGAGWVALGVSASEGEARNLAVASDGSVIRADDVSALTRGSTDSEFRGACVRPDGVVVATGVQRVSDNEARLWSRSTDGTRAWSTVDIGAHPDGVDRLSSDCAVAADGTMVAVGYSSAADDDGLVLVSDDGEVWQPVESDSLGGGGYQRIRSVAALPTGGWILVGNNDRVGQTDAAVWLLDAEGQVERVPDDVALGGEGVQSIKDVTVVGEELLLVGSDRARAGAWSASLDDVLASVEG